jgi:hypothetical protein
MDIRVNRQSFRAGLRLKNHSDRLMFTECEVVRVTDHTVVVRCRRWSRDSWSEPFRCRDRGGSWTEQRFFVLGFGTLLVDLGGAR